jgi:hypothetical protein
VRFLPTATADIRFRDDDYNPHIRYCYTAEGHVTGRTVEAVVAPPPAGNGGDAQRGAPDIGIKNVETGYSQLVYLSRL